MPRSSATNACEVLGVTADCSLTELRSAWRRAVLATHPDQNRASSRQLDERRSIGYYSSRVRVSMIIQYSGYRVLKSVARRSHCARFATFNSIRKNCSFTRSRRLALRSTGVRSLTSVLSSSQSSPCDPPFVFVRISNVSADGWLVVSKRPSLYSLFNRLASQVSTSVARSGYHGTVVLAVVSHQRLVKHTCP